MDEAGEKSGEMVERDNAVAAHEAGEEQAEASEVERDAVADTTPEAR